MLRDELSPPRSIRRSTTMSAIRGEGVPSSRRPIPKLRLRSPRSGSRSSGQSAAERGRRRGLGGRSRFRRALADGAGRYDTMPPPQHRGRARKRPSVLQRRVEVRPLPRVSLTSGVQGTPRPCTKATVLDLAGEFPDAAAGRRAGLERFSSRRGSTISMPENYRRGVLTRYPVFQIP
jgi:hypothetical protein